MREKTKLRCVLGAGLVAAVMLVAVPASARRLRLRVKGVQVQTRGSRPSKKAVKRTVRRNIHKLRSCLKGAVKKKKKGYKGWLWLNFKFRRSGSLKDVAANSTITNKFTMKCIKMHMKRWNMGKGKGGKVTATVRILY
jgi:hypothetical protein